MPLESIRFRYSLFPERLDSEAMVSRSRPWSCLMTLGKCRLTGGVSPGQCAKSLHQKCWPVIFRVDFYPCNIASKHVSCVQMSHTHLRPPWASLMLMSHAWLISKLGLKAMGRKKQQKNRTMKTWVCFRFPCYEDMLRVLGCILQASLSPGWIAAQLHRTIAILVAPTWTLVAGLRKCKGVLRKPATRTAQPFALATWSCSHKHLLHPWSLTWNLKINPWKRRFLLEIIIIRFHVKLWGCMYLFHLCLSTVSLETEVYDWHCYSKPTRERSEVTTAQAQHLWHARMSPWQINAGKRRGCRMRRWGHLASLGEAVACCAKVEVFGDFYQSIFLELAWFL